MKKRIPTIIILKTERSVTLGFPRCMAPKMTEGKEDEDENMVTASAEYSHDEPAVQHFLCKGHQYKGE